MKVYNLQVNQLAQFGLKKNHIKLVNFFLQNIGKELTARDISSQVNIPVSRIYVYLNDLVDLKLVDRKFHNKAKFILTEPESRFREFLLKRDVETKELQKGILDSLRMVSSQDFVLIKSQEEFYESAYSMVKGVKTVRILSHNPLLIFTGENSAHWAGQLFEAYRNAIENHELQFFYIFDNNFFKSRDLARNADVVAEKLQWLSGFDDVELRTVDGKNILPMLAMIITDKAVLIGFSSPQDMKVIRGLLLRSDEMASFFEKIYEQIYAKSKKVNIKSLNTLSASLRLLKKLSLKFRKGSK